LWGEKWRFLKGSGVWRRAGKIIGAAELHEKKIKGGLRRRRRRWKSDNAFSRLPLLWS